MGCFKTLYYANLRETSGNLSFKLYWRSKSDANCAWPLLQSCGEMMFNPSTLVCDWPARVMQLRPECRDAEQLGLHKYPFHRARWPNSRAAND